MSEPYKYIEEVENLIDYIKSLKDKTLDHYHENKPKASGLMVGLSDLELDAENLIKEFESCI
jgi:hypothetical protein